MSLLRKPIPGIVLAAACIACDAYCSPPMSHYHVELDIYVRDQQALCKQAWGIALRRFGPGVAETVTMTAGEPDPIKCLQVVVQTAPMGDEVVSAGLYVREER